MAAADAMVHSTAGLTVLEAHIRGCPVVSYGFSAGHLRANNAAFERFGLAEVARSGHELESILRHLTRERRPPDSSFASLPPISARVLEARRRVRQQPRWRVRAERTATAVAMTVVAVVLVIAIALALDWETPYRAAAKAAKPIESRVHFGNDEDQRGSQKRPLHPGLAGRAGQEAAAQPGPLIGRLAGGAALLAGASLHAGPALAPVVPPLGRALGIRLRQEDPDGVALTFDDGPHPQGTPAVLEALREAGRPGDLLPRRRAGRPASFAGGGDRRRRPPGRAALLPAPQPAAADPAAADRRRGTEPGGDRGGDRAGGPRLPPALRDLQRRRAAGGPAPAAGGRSSGRYGGGTGTAARAPSRSRRRSTAGARAGDVLLLHDADFYSAPGSWARTAAALPRILDELGGRGLRAVALRR